MLAGMDPFGFGWWDVTKRIGASTLGGGLSGALVGAIGGAGAGFLPGLIGGAVAGFVSGTINEIFDMNKPESEKRSGLGSFVSGLVAGIPGGKIAVVAKEMKLLGASLGEVGLSQIQRWFIAGGALSAFTDTLIDGGNIQTAFFNAGVGALSGFGASRLFYWGANGLAGQLLDDPHIAAVIGGTLTGLDAITQNFIMVLSEFSETFAFGSVSNNRFAQLVFSPDDPYQYPPPHAVGSEPWFYEKFGGRGDIPMTPNRPFKPSNNNPAPIGDYPGPLPVTGEWKYRPQRDGDCCRYNMEVRSGFVGPVPLEMFNCLK
jgi:hypothetical protein